MDDRQIVELYWARSESAIEESSKKYGKYCHYIAFNILNNESDSEECVNDTYNAAWNSIPPSRPNKLSAFLGKITRNLAIKKHEQKTALKRGGGTVALALDELSECIAGSDGREDDDAFIKEVLHNFLCDLPEKKRRIFLRRYWYMSSIGDIAREYHMSESNVKIILMRTRNELRNRLVKEGIFNDE